MTAVDVDQFYKRGLPWVFQGNPRRLFVGPRYGLRISGILLQGIRSFPMHHDKSKSDARCNGVLLALVSAMSLGLMGCGEQTGSQTKQEVVARAPTPEQEFALLLKKAEAQETEAQFQLGLRYKNGEGVPKDATRALEWFQKAAAQENAGAQFLLGSMYNDGDSVAVDTAKAVEWFQKAAANGHAFAHHTLGLMYQYGQGVTKDIPKAIDWYQKAALLKDDFSKSSSLTNLGLIYRYGTGVPKDAAKAIGWFQKASVLGDSEAQMHLGMMTLFGEGGAKDAVSAAVWFQKAAEVGNVGAQGFLGSMYLNGDGVPKDAVKAVEWLQKAASQGDAISQTGLGRQYSRGEGISKDMVLAYAWLNLAAGAGQKTAVSSRDIFEAFLSSAEKAEAQRLSSNWKVGQILVREGSASASTASSTGTLTKQGFGTAFYVSKSGQAITNHHVINGCKEVRIEGRDGVVKVVTSDVVNDLTLLQVMGWPMPRRQSTPIQPSCVKERKSLYSASRSTLCCRRAAISHQAS
jgi:uncharacterized protein